MTKIEVSILSDPLFFSYQISICSIFFLLSLILFMFVNMFFQRKSITTAKVFITKADVAPIYLLIKHSHSRASKHFSRCLDMTFTLVEIHF